MKLLKKVPNDAGLFLGGCEVIVLQGARMAAKKSPQVRSLSGASGGVNGVALGALGLEKLRTAREITLGELVRKGRSDGDAVVADDRGLH